MLDMVKCFKMLYFNLQGFSNLDHARLSRYKRVYVHAHVVSHSRYL